MIVAMIPVVLALAVVLFLAAFVQTLYLESLRLRARETPALVFFKEKLEERLGLAGERGALAFALLKHTVIVLLGIVFLTATASVLEAFLLGWCTLMVAGYILPQLLYRTTEARWLDPFTSLLIALTLPVRPVMAVLAFLQSLVDLGNGKEPAEEPATTTEHIEALISASAEEGTIDEEERKLIQSVVDFSEKTVREVMTPRPKIVAIEQDKTLEDLRQIVINEQYSRLPVYEGTIDRMAGFVHVRDMFELDHMQRARRKVRELMRPIRSVPETKKVGDLLREMQQDGAHMAIVIDEYGNTAGLVTLEDLVEEVFGEIRDEHEPARDVTPDGNGRYIVAGSFDLDGLEELFGFRPSEKTQSTTVGGLVTEWFGRVPHAGEAVDREGLHMEVLASDELRVERVRVSRAQAAVTEQSA